MADISKISPDDGSTILNVKDRNAVHWSESQGYVGKNLLNNKATTKTIQQVTFTVNDDKSVKVNGTNSGNENNLELGNMVLKAGKYIVSGTGFNSNTLSYQITDYPVTKQLFRIYNGDTEITLENDTHILVRLVISQGGTYSNHTVYPMLRLASISDNTYEPYLTPNTEIDNKLSYADNTVLGAKNLLNYTSNGLTYGGITIVVNDDKSLTWSGTHSGDGNITLKLLDKVVFPAGDYIFSGCPQGGSPSTYFQMVSVYSSNDSWVADYKDFGDGVNFSITEGQKISVYSPYSPAANKTHQVSGTFYPMIRLASDTDDTYAPYAMTNRELTDKVTQSLEDVTTTFKNEVVVSGSTITNVEWARKIRYGNILIFQARVNKAANTKINQNLNCPLTFPETFLSNSLLTMASASNATTATFDKIDKKISFRYDTSDGTTYVDLQMIAIIV